MGSGMKKDQMMKGFHKRTESPPQMDLKKVARAFNCHLGEQFYDYMKRGEMTELLFLFLS